jgi:hypothetical protein
MPLFPRRVPAPLLVLLLALVAGPGGCSTAYVPPSDTAEVKHIKKVHELVNEYKQANGKVPANAAELKGWAVKEGKAADGDFVSPRDNKPYVVVTVPMPIGLSVVHEQDGVGGKKLFCNVGSSASEMSADEVKAAVAGLPKPPNIPNMPRR